MVKRYSYWIFYAILGIGLVLSWTQVGKRTQLIKGTPVRVLSLDKTCQPWLSPCAAYARDFALILGVDGASELRLVGEKLPDAITIKLMHFIDAKELPEPMLKQLDENQWRIMPSGKLGRLRVNIQRENQQWIAEFPLSVEGVVEVNEKL